MQLELAFFVASQAIKMTHQTRHVFSVFSVQLALDLKFGFTWKILTKPERVQQSL